MNSLTDQQMRIIECALPQVKILSAAGSGKTTVLTEKAAKFCEDTGSDGSDMLLITFTRRAGKELESRLPRACQHATVGTFHSCILNEMQKNGSQPNVLSEEETDSLIEACATKLGLRVGGRYLKGSTAQLRKEITRARVGNAAQTPLVKMFHSTLAINGDIDFEGILYEGIRMAETGAFNWVRFLAVDESQDNEPLQWQFIMRIAEHARVMVVGDVGQSLYSFRGAEPEQFTNLPWPELPMQESFRFPSNISAVANKIGATTLKVVSHKPPVPIGIHRGARVEDLDRWLLDQYDPQDIAVLCRYNAHVEQLRSDLSLAGISVVTPSIRWHGPVHHFLSYLCSPGSSVARNRVIASWNDKRPFIVQYIASSASNQAAGSTALEWMAGDSTVAGVLSKLEVPASMVPEVKYLITEYGHMSVVQYYCETAQEEWIAEGRGVSVGTVHWSKGGQWPAVILPCLEKGKWPRRAPTAEELRVLYVAITRTQHELHLQYDGEPSPFLEFFK